MDIESAGILATMIGTGLALWRSFTGASEKRMREIASEIVNPELQKERHEATKAALERIETCLEQQSVIVERATLAGVQAGYRMAIKRNSANRGGSMVLSNDEDF